MKYRRSTEINVFCFPGNTHLWGETQEKEIIYNLYSRPTEFAHPVSF